MLAAKRVFDESPNQGNSVALLGQCLCTEGRHWAPWAAADNSYLHL
jgi:hypothetical protein